MPTDLEKILNENLVKINENPIKLDKMVLLPEFELLLESET